MGNTLKMQLQQEAEKMSGTGRGKLFESALERISELEEREAEMAATVDKLRDFADKVHHWNECTSEYRINYGSNGERDYYRDMAGAALEATPASNLNAHNREVAREAIIAAIDDYKREYCGQGIEALLSSFADIYPAQRYPDKE